MKILVQWSLADPTDWQEVDLLPTGQANRRWLDSPKKPKPTGGETIDNNPGWIYDAAIYGIWLGGMDAYAVQIIGSGQNFYLRVTAWNDDPEDYPPGTRWARVMDFYNQFPHRVDKTYFAEPNASVQALGPHSITSIGGYVSQVVYRPWSEFVKPAENLVRYGIWLPTELNNLHVQRRRVPDYREWL